MYCPNCNSELAVKFSKVYDAFYCEACDIWVEDKCKDPYCTICTKRPDNPSQIK